jgi:hypothetical protein
VNDPRENQRDALADILQLHLVKRASGIFKIRTFPNSATPELL